MGAWNLERWTVYKSDTFVGDKGFTVSVPRNYNNAYVFRLGRVRSRTVPAALTLRIGGLRSISDQPSDTLSPDLTDANSWAFSRARATRSSHRCAPTSAISTRSWARLTATGSEAFPGTYKTTVEFLSFGLVARADL